MSDRVEWMEGTLVMVEPGQTGSRNPKTTLHVKPDINQDYTAKVHYSGRDLTKIPQNIGQYANYKIQVGYTLWELPSHPGSFSKQGCGLVLCDQSRNLPALPASTPETAHTPPPITSGSPAGTGSQVSGPPWIPPSPAPPAGPPAEPFQQPTTPPPAPPPVASPQTTSVPTSKDLAIARQAVIKSPLLAVLMDKPTIGKARILIDYFIGYVFDQTPRITGGQHRRLESMIAEVIGPANRGLFKEFLFSEAMYEEMADSGSLHLTDMSQEHADKLMDEYWDSMLVAWREFRKVEDTTPSPDVAPEPESEAPPFAQG